MEQLSANTTPDQSQFKQLRQQFSALGTLPKACSQGIKKRYETACSNIESVQIKATQQEKLIQARTLLDDTQRNDVIPSYEQVEELCIQLEIMTGIDSPDNAKKSRMAYQVQRFNEGVTFTSADADDQAQQALELARQWNALGSNDSTEYQQLQQRFLQTLDHIK